MVLHWHPVGPEPAPTYWQRRAVVLAVVLVVLVFLVTALTGSDGTPSEQVVAVGPSSAAPSPAGTGTGPATPAPTSSPTAGPTPSPSAAVTACAPGALTLSATADRPDYPVGGRPLLVLTVTNTGATPCSRDLGQGAVELLVVSGTDRIWSSDDCAAGGPAKQVVLDPSEASVTRLAWTGRRSLPGCAGDKRAAQAGTYRVGARVGDLRTQGAPFVLR